MRYGVQMMVELKGGLLDPQGKAVEGALPALGWDNVTDVRVGKYIHFSIEAADEETASRQAVEMAERFLTNPVIEDFTIFDVYQQDALPLSAEEAAT